MVRLPRNDAEIDRRFADYVRDGTPDALGDVFDACAPRLVLLGHRLLGDREEAEDLVQRVFLEAIRSTERFEAGRAVLPWLTTILVRRAANARVRRPRDANVGDDGIERVEGREVDPAQAAAEREYAEAVAEAVRALPEPYRQALTLRFVHGLEPMQIAKALGRPPGTVHAQLSRGLERLRPRLSHLVTLAAACGVGSRLDAMPTLTAARTAVLDAAGRLTTAPTAATTSEIAHVGAGAGRSTFSLIGILTMVTTNLWIGAAVLAGLTMLYLTTPPASERPMQPASASAGTPTATMASTAGVVASSEDRGNVPVGAREVVQSSLGEQDETPSVGTPFATGRCIDTDGTPIAGVRVTLSARSLTQPAGRTLSVGPRVDSETTTAADGRFELDAPGPIDEAEGWTIGLRSVSTISETISNRRGELGDLTLDPGVVLTLRVVSTEPSDDGAWSVFLHRDDDASRESGHPALGRTVRRRVEVDRSGHATIERALQPGTWLVDANPTGARDIRPSVLELAAGEHDVTLIADPLPTIRGHLIDDSGQPVQSSLAISGPGMPPPTAWVTFQPTDSDGRFLLRAQRDVEEGVEATIRVAEKPNYRGVTVGVPWGTRDARLTLPRRPLLLIEARDSTGASIDDYTLGFGDDPTELAATPTWTNPYFEQVGGFVLPADSTWVCVLPRDPQLGASEVRRVDLQPGENRLRVEVPPSPTVRIRATAADGLPLPAVKVALYSQTFEGAEPDTSAWPQWGPGVYARPSFSNTPRACSRSEFARTDADGIAMVRRTWDGPTWVHAVADHDEVWQRIDADTHDVSIQLGTPPTVQARLVLEIGPGLPEWIEKADLVRTRADNDGPEHCTGARIGDRLVFTRVPHGRWRLHLGESTVARVVTGDEPTILVDGADELHRIRPAPGAVPGRLHLTWTSTTKQNIGACEILAPDGQRLVSRSPRGFDADAPLQLAPGTYTVEWFATDDRSRPMGTKTVVIAAGRDVECSLDG